jgi:hypothetical protein
MNISVKKISRLDLIFGMELVLCMTPIFRPVPHFFVATRQFPLYGKLGNLTAASMAEYSYVKKRSPAVVSFNTAIGDFSK